MVPGFSRASASAPLMSFAGKLGCEDQERRRRHQAHRGEVLDRVVAGVRRHQRIGDVARHDHHQGLAVGGKLGQLHGGERAVGARAIFHDDRAAPGFLELVADLTRQDVGGAAGREAGENPDRTVGIGLRRAGDRSGQRQRRREQEPIPPSHCASSPASAPVADMV
jgi:hypothetical protein